MIKFECIAGLVKRQDRPILQDYLLFLELGEKHFVFSDRPKSLLQTKLLLLEKALRQEFPLKKNFLARLQENFIRENLSIALLLDVLQGWRYAVHETRTKEQGLDEISGYILAPLARLLMVLHNEPPSTYLPMSAILICLYELEEKGAGMPIWQRNKKIKFKKMRRLNGLLNDSKVILQILSSKRLKFKIAILRNILLAKVEKLEKNKQPNLGILDVLKIFLYSAWQFVFIRRKTLYQKGM